MLQSMGSQRVGHNLVAEQQQQTTNGTARALLFPCFFFFFPLLHQTVLHIYIFTKYLLNEFSPLFIDCISPSTYRWIPLWV